ncbi:MAG TPA: hypothetical protein VLJ68_07450 [Chitinophagaceae bacterium]|nr:hypothetical protein [Chitinophagaceae bacterium]
MKLFFLITLFTGLIACHKKAMPTITTRTQEPPPPAVPAGRQVALSGRAMTDSNLVAVDLVQGKSVFTESCSRCHDLPDPAKYAGTRWERILGRMIPRARLNRVEASNVRAYVLTNSAK